MQKRQKYNSLLLQKIIIKPLSLVALCATGLFAVNSPDDIFTSKISKTAIFKPVKGLNDEQVDKFILGKSFFRIPWVEAPSATTARDGLGPLFNANTCISCHPYNGRGELFSKKNTLSRSLLAKLSIKSNGSQEHKMQEKYQGFVQEEVYGGQLSLNGIHGVPFEGRPTVTFEEKKVVFPDKEVVTLLKPNFKLENLNYGKMHKDVAISYRMAPTLMGMGLIELISDEQILENQDINDKDGDGISGKANFVYSVETKKQELGRYTWKASSVTVKQQVAVAMNNDMGLTTPLYPDENCTKSQKLCNESPKGLKDKFDVTKERLDAVTFYVKNQKVYRPKKDDEFKKGLKLFEKVGCAKCHISSFETNLGFSVEPYSDFLLHDMGEELKDGRSEFLATQSEFRTPMLWGLALHEKINNKKPRLLHDGRARNFQEAILWHGGEASGVRQNYMNLTKEKREELLKFLGKL